MPVPVLIQIAAEKDSSVQRVAAEVNQALKAMGSDAKFDPFTGFSEASKKALADIQKFKAQAATASWSAGLDTAEGRTRVPHFSGQAKGGSRTAGHYRTGCPKGRTAQPRYPKPGC